MLTKVFIQYQMSYKIFQKDIVYVSDVIREQTKIINFGNEIYQTLDLQRTIKVCKTS